MSDWTYTACVLSWMVCMVAALGCGLAWAVNMLTDGNRNEHHLIRAGAFVAVGTVAGFLALAT